MDIASIEPIALRLPMKKPVIMAGETVAHADNVLVRIETDDGTVGWGEAAAAPLMTGDTLDSIVSAARHLAPALAGRAVADIAGARAAMEARLHGNQSAKAAIEIALYDLAGKTAGVPVHALLGDRQRIRLPLLATLGGGDLDGDLHDAAAKKTQGFTVYKIKVGADTPERDAARTRTICAALGAPMLISADANQGYSVDEALAYLRAVEGCGLDFFEQPIDAHDLSGMARIAAATAIAIGADEGIHAPADIERHHAMKAARGVSLKAIKLGGLHALSEAARLCASLGMKVNIACKTGESSVACAAALHVASTVPAIDWGLSLTHGGLAEDVTARPLPTARGHAECLDRPGLGIAVDEDRVRRHRVPVAARHVA